MATRKRASATTSPAPKPESEKPKPESPTTDPPIRPAKFLTILKFSLIFLIPYFYLIFSHYRIDYELKKSILINGLVSIIGFLITVKLIPVASKYVLRRNLFGYDINKKGTPDGSIKVPESLGIVVGIVFLVVTILFQYFNFTADSNWLVEYNAALASICFMILLGFVDDVLDVPWRVKLVLPSIAALPLLMAYAGHTTIIIPKPLVPYVGLDILDLGWIYKLYMGLLAVFCTNSINIHAGINGLEVGQTVVISCAIVIHNIMQIGASTDPEYKQGNYISCTFVAPKLRSPKSARVILSGGEIRQFRQPVKAAELMLECPNYCLVNSKSLNIGRRFSPLLADEDLEFGNLYVMFPMRRVNSIVTAADVTVFLMTANSAPKRIPGGNNVKISPDTAVDVSNGDGRSRLIPEGVESEYKYRLAVCRSKRPGLDTITEEPLCL